jgi:uncharacterized protein
MRLLNVLEARILGVLVEKAHTVPDSYPLSLNALTLGCNQKTARDPVLNVSDAEVQIAVDALSEFELLAEASGSRVKKYQHFVARGLGIPSQAVVLLTLLILRGPQTTAELRQNAERLYRFADHSSVEGFLDELSARAEEKGGPLVILLPRAAGAREPRWAHLLCGAVDGASLCAVAKSSGVDPAAMSQEITELKTQVQTLQNQVQQLFDELGIKPGLSSGEST